MKTKAAKVEQVSSQRVVDGESYFRPAHAPYIPTAAEQLTGKKKIGLLLDAAEAGAIDEATFRSTLGIA